MNKKCIHFYFRKLPVIIITLLFIIWPFLVISKKIVVNSPKMSVLLSGLYINFFTYYRILAWSIVTLLLLIIFISSFFFNKYKIHFTESYSILLCLFIWILFSAILSPYKEAFFGMHDRTRGLFAYIIMFVFSFLISIFIRNKEHQKLIFYGFLICSFFIVIFSTLQFFNFDPFLRTPLKHLIGNINIVSAREYLNTTFAGLYNKNVLGSFLSISLIVFSLLYFLNSKKTKKAIFYFFSLLTFASIISSFTRGAWISIFVVFVLLIIFDKNISLKEYIILISSFILIFIIMDLISPRKYYMRLVDSTLVSVILLVFILITMSLKKFIPKISTKILFFSIFVIIISGIFIFSVLTPHYFKDNEKIMNLGSKRPYIFWTVSETIFKNPAFGTGPETLLFNIDVEDEYRYKYLKDQFIDKAHSIYLGIAVDSGIGALLLFVYLCSLILNSLWIHRHKIGAKITFWGIIVYLIQGLAFDANICSDILFFTLLGIGLYYSNMVENRLLKLTLMI